MTGGSGERNRMEGALAHAGRAGAAAHVSVSYLLQVGDIVWGRKTSVTWNRLCRQRAFTGEGTVSITHTHTHTGQHM